MSAFEFLRGIFRRKESAPSRGRSLPDQSLWEQFKRIGGSLTPVQVSNIIRQADGGNLQSLVDLANDARQKDGSLQSALGTREKAVASLEWQLVFPGRSLKSTSGARQRKLVESCLRQHDEFPSAIEHLAGAAYYGHGVVENRWTTDASGKLVIANFVNQSPRRFGYRPRDGAFVWEDTGSVSQGTPMSDFPVGNFAISHPRINGDVPCREGLARVLMWAALFRNWTLSDWLKLGEIGWRPWRVGVYQKGASDEDIDNLTDILDGMSTSGTAVIPNTTEVKVEWPGGQAMKASHAELFDKLGAEMSKAVLGQTLTMDQGARGSQALGKVHNEVRKDILEADARHVAAVITRDIVTPMVRFNMGPTAEVPRFVFVTQDKEDLETFSVGIANLAKAGLRIPADWVRDKAGIPHPEDGDELVTVGEESADAEAEPDESDPNETPADDADEPA